MKFSRRSFVVRGTSLVAAASLCKAGWTQQAQLVPESDPTAVALGYRADATTVDRNKFAQYAPGQQCSECALFQGDRSASNGPCAVFGGKLVSTKGWCSSFVKKA
jgi:hypothetical protein